LYGVTKRKKEKKKEKSREKNKEKKCEFHAKSVGPGMSWVALMK